MVDYKRNPERLSGPNDPGKEPKNAQFHRHARRPRRLGNACFLRSSGLGGRLTLRRDAEPDPLRSRRRRAQGRPERHPPTSHRRGPLPRQQPARRRQGVPGRTEASRSRRWDLNGREVNPPISGWGGGPCEAWWRGSRQKLAGYPSITLRPTAAAQPVPGSRHAPGMPIRLHPPPHGFAAGRIKAVPMRNLLIPGT